MKKELIQSYTNRITQGKRSEIIVVMYEIFFSYMEDAKMALTKEDDRMAAIEALRRASMVMEHLKDDLDFKYSIAEELYPLYVFIQREIAKEIYLLDPEKITPIENVAKPLHEAFVEVAKQDDSAAVMKNTQEVVAGYTYGRSDLNEAMAGYDHSRGFLA